MADVDTSITDVTVYTDRARVTRRGTTHLSSGEQTLSIQNVPTSLQDDSVRAAGRGAGVRILGVETVTNYVTVSPEEDLATLQKELESLQDEDAALADGAAAEDARQEYLKNLRISTSQTLPRGIAYGKAGMDSVTALTKFIEDEFAASQGTKREIAQQRRDLARQIEAVQKRLEPRWDSQERRGINVIVEAAAETDFDLEVTYSVVGASWSPLYDIRLVENKVTLGYLANVQQQTGEDWPEVKLSLSTARPAVSATIPELDPWFVDIYIPPVPRPMSRAAGGAALPMQAMAAASAPMMEEAFAMKQAEPPPEADIATATVDNTGASVTFRVARPTAIPSDGSPHKTMVTNLDLAAALDYVTVPKMAEEAYLRAKITNTSDSILLPGSANIFHEDEFVGTTLLESVVPTEEFEVQLGVDDRVKVERKLSQRDTSKAFIGNTRRTLYGYKITITNLLTWPARVTVYDQLPVSRNEQIKSKLQEVTPPPTEQTDMNILKWELDLTPQQKQEIAFTFLVEQPRDVRITGIEV
ncbi:MAG: mucoidy inhibitor MuiA family protein [Chloroflexota bacterium]